MESGRNWPTLLARLDSLLRNPGVRGLGEVGLDRTFAHAHWTIQEEALGSLLRLLSPMQVLVLHYCGPLHQDPTATYTRLQTLLVKARVPVQQKIHLHCFNGPLAVVDNWSLVFPGTKFGFTLLVQSFDDEQKDALRLWSRLRSWWRRTRRTSPRMAMGSPRPRWSELWWRQLPGFGGDLRAGLPGLRPGCPGPLPQLRREGDWEGEGYWDI
jgi:hypothetical protein